MSATNAQLASRLTKLEKQVAENRREDLKTATAISKTDHLNQLIKAYDKNIKIVGLVYDIKESRTFNTKSYDEWCVKVVSAALVDTKVVKEEEVFERKGGERKLIRAIVSNIHPLNGRNNAAIVVAFNEASFAQQIKETVRKDRGLSMGKIRIHVHLPPILDALHNAALKARREELEKAKREGKSRKIHCNITLSPPWIQLIEINENGVKAPIPFEVEDGRLVDPADTLATLALRERGKDSFKPFKFLSEAEKKAIPRNVTIIPRQKDLDAHNGALPMDQQ